MSIAPDDPRHGTANGYQNLGCRCDRCRAAIAAYLLAWRHKTGRNKPRAEYLAEMASLPIQHGTESAYTNRGCRCQPCKAASAAGRRRRRHVA